MGAQDPRRLDDLVATVKGLRAQVAALQNTALNRIATHTHAATGGVASVSAGDSTITIGGTGTAPTVEVNAIAESQVTNLATDLSTLTTNVAAKVASVAAGNTTVTIGGTGTAPTVAANIGLAGGQRYTTSGTLATIAANTDTVAMSSGSLTLQASSVYTIRARVKFDSTVAGDAAIFHIRDTNASGTQRGEELRKIQFASSSEEAYLETTYVTTTAVTVTFVLTIARFSGSGTCHVYGDSGNPGFVMVYREGPSTLITSV